MHSTTAPKLRGPPHNSHEYLAFVGRPAAASIGCSADVPFKSDTSSATVTSMLVHKSTKDTVN